MVRIALWALRIYLLILLSLIGLKFARIYSQSRNDSKAAETTAAKPDASSAPGR
jgi:hypothetical protein